MKHRALLQLASKPVLVLPRGLVAAGHLFSPRKLDEILIDVGKPGSVDETYAHKPGVIWHNGALYHFYCAVSGKWPNEVRGTSVASSKPFRVRFPAALRFKRPRRRWSADLNAKSSPAVTSGMR